MITWKTEQRKVSDLIPAPYNPRELTEGQAKQLTASLERFNLADPIVINSDNTIIGGHQRINIYKLHNKNDVFVDVRVPSRKLNPEEEKELNLRLNKNLGQWDFDMLANFDEDLLKDVGFDSKELDSIFQLDATIEDDDVPDTRLQTDIKTGDMFKLGEHILLCGDSTDRASVERLMGGEKADMVFTDPPYGISWNTDYSNLGKGKARHCRNVFKKIEGDSKEFEPYSLFDLSEILFLFGANYYSSKLPNGGWIIWDKAHESGNYLFSQAEGAWTNKINCVRIFKHKWQGHDRQSERGVKTMHPTQKPVQLIIDILMDLFLDFKVIIDPYGGSGSTLIACEKLNRKCRMMEIDPIYCQVIIDRWEKITNKKATKLENCHV